jgi:mRNA interferase RelE/StbE
MEVEFLRSFEKDLSKVKAPLRKKVLQLIRTMEAADTLEQVAQVKRLSGTKDAFRVRLGDHRVGFFHAKGKVQFARLLHRREVYRFFP